MDALKARKRYDNARMIEAYEQRQKEEAEKIAAMSDEERAAYLEEKKKREKAAMQILSLGLSLGGPYMSDFK